MKKRFYFICRLLKVIILLDGAIIKITSFLSHIQKLRAVLREFCLQDVLVTFVVLILVWTLEKIFEKGLK